MTTDYSSEVAGVVQALEAVYENKQSNKKNSLSGSYGSDTESYPTCQAVKNAYGSKKTSWSSTVSDSDVPSEKLVKDSLDGKEDVSNKISSTTGWSTTLTETKYPSEKLVKSTLDTKENISNKVSSSTGWGGTLSDDKYPSEKLVKQSLNSKEDSSNKVTTWSNEPSDSKYPSEKLVFGAIVTHTHDGVYAPLSHNQATSTITNSATYSNISSSTLSTQADINSAINTVIGTLKNFSVIEVTADKGTATADKMNKIWIEHVTGSSTTEAYFVVESSGNYAWVKFEDIVLDDYPDPATEVRAFASQLATGINALSNSS